MTIRFLRVFCSFDRAPHPLGARIGACRTCRAPVWAALCAATLSLRVEASPEARSGHRQRARRRHFRASRAPAVHVSCRTKCAARLRGVIQERRRRFGGRTASRRAPRPVTKQDVGAGLPPRHLAGGRHVTLSESHVTSELGARAAAAEQHPSQRVLQRGATEQVGRRGREVSRQSEVQPAALTRRAILAWHPEFGARAAASGRLLKPRFLRRCAVHSWYDSARAPRRRESTPGHRGARSKERKTRK